MAPTSRSRRPSALDAPESEGSSSKPAAQRPCASPPVWSQTPRVSARGARALDCRHAPRYDPAVASHQGQLLSSSRRSPFSRLVYPMPTPDLGVHLTLDLAGQAKFGPDVEWVDAADYDVDPRRAGSFYAAIRTYWPERARCSQAMLASDRRPPGREARPRISSCRPKKDHRRRRINQPIWDRVT